MLTHHLLVLHIIDFSQDSPIIPQPAELKMGQGSFIVNNKTAIVTKGGLDKSAKFLQSYLKKMYGLVLPISTTANNNGNIVLSYARLDYPIAGAYHLEVKNNGVIIEGDNETGVFYGVQSLIQLFPFAKTNSLAIPQLWVKDQPRFAYRGMHLDVARHFFR